MKKRNKGFTLLIAVVTTSLLLLVSFVVADIALKQIILSSSNQDSQYAFYSADSGAECAVYWDAQTAAGVFNSGAQASFQNIYIDEFNGIDTVDPLDQVSENKGMTGTPNNQATSTSFVSLVYPVELIFGHAEVSQGNVKEGPGFTKITWSSNNDEEFATTSSAGSYNAPFKLNPTGNYIEWIGIMAAFKAASGQIPTKKQNFSALGNTNNPGNPGYVITFNSPSIAGNLIIVSINYNSNSAPIYLLTDNKGNRYFRASSHLVWPLGGSSTELWYAKNIINATAGSPSSERITITAHSQAFSPGTINCNGQTISTDTQNISVSPTGKSIIGGAPVSYFELDFAKGCAIVTVTKDSVANTTVIESRGYNTCDTSAARRYERAVRASY